VNEWLISYIVRDTTGKTVFIGSYVKESSGIFKEDMESMQDEALNDVNCKSAVLSEYLGCVAEVLGFSKFK